MLKYPITQNDNGGARMASLCGLNGHVADVMTRKNGVSASTIQMLGLGSPRQPCAGSKAALLHGLQGPLT